MSHKEVHNDVLDAALNYLKNNATKLCVCKTSTDTYAKANSTNLLAGVVINSTDFGAVTSGDSSGRKVQVSQQELISVDVTGKAEEVALVNTSSSKLLYVTKCSAKSLSSTDKVTVPAWDVEIGDPT